MAVSPTAKGGLKADARKMMFGIAAVVLGLLFWAIKLPGLTAQGRVSVALLVFVLVLWIGEVMNYAYATFLYLALLVATNAVKMSTAFSGFTSSTFWLILSAFTIGVGASKTGVSQRIAYYIIRFSRGKYNYLVYTLWIALTILGFLVPSSTVRISIVFPIIMGMIQLYKAEGTKLGANLMWHTFFAGLFGPRLVMQAGIQNVLTVGQLSQGYHITISWSDWFLYNLIPTVIIIALMPIAVNMIIRPEKELLAESGVGGVSRVKVQGAGTGYD